MHGLCTSVYSLRRRRVSTMATEVYKRRNGIWGGEETRRTTYVRSAAKARHQTNNGDRKMTCSKCGRTECSTASYEEAYMWGWRMLWRYDVLLCPACVEDADAWTEAIDL